MSITTSLKSGDDFSDYDLEGLRALKKAVYPPEEEGAWEGGSRE